MRRSFVQAICGFERELSFFEHVCILEKRLKETLFFSLFVACNDNDVVKGDFADKATLKYGTPIILALYPVNVGIQAECRRVEVQYRVTVAGFPQRVSICKFPSNLGY